jgi:hypothetical protein
MTVYELCWAADLIHRDRNTIMQQSEKNMGTTMKQSKANTEMERRHKSGNDLSG